MFVLTGQFSGVTPGENREKANKGTENDSSNTMKNTNVTTYTTCRQGCKFSGNLISGGNFLKD